MFPAASCFVVLNTTTAIGAAPDAGVMTGAVDDDHEVTNQPERPSEVPVAQRGSADDNPRSSRTSRESWSSTGVDSNSSSSGTS